MSEKTLLFLTLVSALGCGLIAGVFFAFSTFIMKAISRIPPAQGIAAMQSINVVAISPLLMVALFGTAVACLLWIAFSLNSWQNPGSAYRIAGSLLYLACTILVTMMCNVPRNNALAAVDPGSAHGSALWADYVASWTAWNHVRTIGSLAAAALFSLALCAPAAARKL